MWQGNTQDLHRVRHIEGHCNNIHKGRVRVGFWVGNCQHGEAGDASTGWQSVSRIFIKIALSRNSQKRLEHTENHKKQVIKPWSFMFSQLFSPIKVKIVDKMMQSDYLCVILFVKYKKLPLLAVLT